MIDCQMNFDGISIAHVFWCVLIYIRMRFRWNAINLRTARPISRISIMWNIENILWCLCSPHWLFIMEQTNSKTIKNCFLSILMQFFPSLPCIGRVLHIFSYKCLVSIILKFLPSSERHTYLDFIFVMI